MAGCNEDVLMQLEETELPIGTDLMLNVNPGGAAAGDVLNNCPRDSGRRLYSFCFSKVDRGRWSLTNPRTISITVSSLTRSFRRSDQANSGNSSCSSHNANIPVLGDADQIVVLEAHEHDGQMSGRLVGEATGSLDKPVVREQVEELLEGEKGRLRDPSVSLRVLTNEPVSLCLDLTHCRSSCDVAFVGAPRTTAMPRPGATGASRWAG